MSRVDEISLRTDLFSSRTQVLQEVIFHATLSNNSLRDKMNGGPFFSVQNKNLRIKKDQRLITDFLIYECLHLTGPEVNFAFDV